MAELNARLTALRNVLPEQKDVGDLLRRIQTLATQSSLTIRGFKPQAVAMRQQHAEWPISLTLEGSYHDLGAFFDKVSRMPRIINISGIQHQDRTARTSRHRPPSTPSAPSPPSSSWRRRPHRRPVAGVARPPAAHVLLRLLAEVLPCCPD